MSEQSAPSLQRPAIVGHRGASAHAPENTLAAFRRGIEDGAQVLECDVHLSADGHVVVMHDETIDRTAAPDSPRRTGAIGDLTRAELDTVLLADGEKGALARGAAGDDHRADLHRGQGRGGGEGSGRTAARAPRPDRRRRPPP